jgi:histidinol-phosphate/aromatic aminotransferase/cobyric acid decarboxylase-like protein
MTRLPPVGAHGGDGRALAHALDIDVDSVLDLSMSLNPCAPDVGHLVAAHAGEVRRYPDPRVATEALAQALGVPPERVVLTNGGAEAIALVAAAMPVGHVDDPDFSLYARHLQARAPGAPRWRSNPHNPSGALARSTEHAAVWDEAFYPLATGVWTRGDAGAVVVGSLTKVFACPGLRLGYVVAPNVDVANRVRARQAEWSVSSIACAVLPELLDRADLEHWAKEIGRLRTALVEVLAGAAIVPDPSDANFVLVRSAAGLRGHLAQHGILIRDTASFGILDGARIAVPDDAGLDRLARALSGYRP